MSSFRRQSARKRKMRRYCRYRSTVAITAAKLGCLLKGIDSGWSSTHGGRRQAEGLLNYWGAPGDGFAGSNPARVAPNDTVRSRRLDDREAVFHVAISGLPHRRWEVLPSRLLVMQIVGPQRAFRKTLRDRGRVLWR